MAPAIGDMDFLERLKLKTASELSALLDALTPQERVILDHIVQGHCNKQICKALQIEITTAKAHTSRIFRKLDVKNRVQAAVLRLWAMFLMNQAATSATGYTAPNILTRTPVDSLADVTHALTQ
jgi:DNA-binding CsgD family transcriptional regulator